MGLSCEDLKERFGLDVSCCDSCHEDEGMGYEMMDGELKTGEYYYCCCFVSSAIPKESKR